ncbi:MAG: TfpX/TfpZ family type IV pilin accessory protein [Casimicrobium sp.]
MTRFRAAAIHLGISALIAASVFILLWFIWYPNPLLEAVGGTKLFLMLLGIDVCLGPLLTFVVFKTGKKTLKFDLAVIALLQVAALLYGVYTFYMSRPVHIVNVGFRNDIVRAIDINRASLDKSGRSLSLWGPEWIGAKPPTDPAAADRMIEQAMSGGSDISAMPEYYVPIESMKDKMLKESKSIDILKKINKERNAEIDAWLASKSLNAADVKFQPLRSEAKDMAVIIDAKTAKVLGIAPFYPWE